MDVFVLSITTELNFRTWRASGHGPKTNRKWAENLTEPSRAEQPETGKGSKKFFSSDHRRIRSLILLQNYWNFSES